VEKPPNSAEAAYRRADERGDPGGASNLGMLLAERGDLERAEAAWRRADERGDSGGAYNLGMLLAERGDLEGAKAAWRRAADSPDQQVTTPARDALSPTDD
jgi:hypothetical protein